MGDPERDTEDFTGLARKAVELALAAGADEAEAYLTSESYLSLTARKREVEKIEQAIVTGLGLKVFKDRQKAYVTGSALSEDAIRKMARRALDYAVETSIEEANRLPDDARGQFELSLFDEELAAHGLEEKLGLLRRVEEAAYAADPRIDNTQEASYWDGTFQKVHANSRGLLARERKTHCGVSIGVIARAGDERQVGGQYQTVRQFAAIEPDSVGREAAAVAVRKLGARPVKSCRAPVVFDNRVGLRFLGYLIGAVNGERVALNETFLAGKLGTAIAPSHVHLIDEADRPGGYANSLVDGEGVPTSNRRIVEGGVLTTYLHNLYSALKSGTCPTGSVQRGSYEREGSIGAHNLHLAPGTATRDQVIATVPAGLLVTDLMGMGLNLVSGNYSIGASGVWIENGQLTHPVERVTIASNISDMLMGIEEIGSDLRFWAGTGCPTFKLREMAISGQ
jgi:PmbA protein